ncbi:MAG: hypothetical protein ACRD0P_08115 [Stackebrandtia sp.]
MTAASGEGAVRVDLGALRGFTATLRTRIGGALTVRGTGLETQFFPAGRDEERRPFGRSRHHANAEAIGRLHHRNAVAHLNRLGQLRDGLAMTRQLAERLLERYRGVDERQEITAAAIDDILAELRKSRVETTRA